MKDRPQEEEIPTFYREYVRKVSGTDLIEGLGIALARCDSFGAGSSEDMGDHRYAPGKWSIKQVLQHLNDCERILAYRALCFARGEQLELPGFEEDAYAEQADCSHRTIGDLLLEHRTIRNGTIALFRSFTPEMLVRSGTANGIRISVRAIGWSIAGHAEHHCDILEQRYR